MARPPSALLILLIPEYGEWEHIGDFRVKEELGGPGRAGKIKLFG